MTRASLGAPAWLDRQAGYGRDGGFNIYAREVEDVLASVGKIDKKVLRARYWPETGRAVH
jgi:hypothetical protein